MNENHDERGLFSSGPAGSHARLDKTASIVHDHTKISASMSRGAFEKRLNQDKSLSHFDRRKALAGYDRADANRRAATFGKRNPIPMKARAQVAARHNAARGRMYGTPPVAVNRG